MQIIDDLFSHKIHATDLEDWKRTLVKVAEVFKILDGRPYDSTEMDNRLGKLAPGAKRSAFRDQFSIYMSNLGVGRIARVSNKWHVQLSETARAFLLGETPDVASFCRLQLTLFQRPDARGRNYSVNGHLEQQSSAIRWRMVEAGYRLCPLRLVVAGLEEKGKLTGEMRSSVKITATELYTLANDPRVYKEPCPNGKAVASVLKYLANGAIMPAKVGRKSFKFLEATDLFRVHSHGMISFLTTGDLASDTVKEDQCSAIRQSESFFEGFSKSKSVHELREVAFSEAWDDYFDALRTLNPSVIKRLTSQPPIAERTKDSVSDAVALNETTSPAEEPNVKKTTENKPFFAKDKPTTFSIAVAKADPEQTRIKRERRNAYHDLILKIIAGKLMINNIKSSFNESIDLYALIQNPALQLGERFSTAASYLEGASLPYFHDGNLDDVSLLFEAKSVEESILIPQTRRGISQLYEYRYRYSSNVLTKNVVLVLALQASPRQESWLTDYLVGDRGIAVCWLNEALDGLICPKECFPLLAAIVDGVG